MCMQLCLNFMWRRAGVEDVGQGRLVGWGSICEATGMPSFLLDKGLHIQPDAGRSNTLLEVSFSPMLWKEAQYTQGFPGVNFGGLCLSLSSGT